MYQKKLEAYKNLNLEAEISVASPHRIIQMLMQGVMERLAQCKGAITRRDFEAKSTAVSKALALINGLQDSLDFSQGKIAEDLYSLYSYMNKKIMSASINMNIDDIDEVAQLMITIKSAWDQIPEKEQQKANEIRETQGISK
ncbi:flagellar export chaperone FliS [uncultured Tolumonas sp.]|uniref:flagellar export chaperone FliS n=1 Tax=uncultured Tolumonas sp. TaxID=263765 RepID=UPI002A0A5C8A|nr:flagellar export chaperone FliS [uncultured Tolumonas sp.]